MRHGPAGTEVRAGGASGAERRLPAAQERRTEERAVPRSPRAPRRAEPIPASGRGGARGQRWMRSEGRSAPGRGCSPWGRARGGAEGRGAAARGEQRGAAPEGRALRYGAVLERRWESCRGKCAQDGFGKGGVPWGGTCGAGAERPRRGRCVLWADCSQCSLFLCTA